MNISGSYSGINLLKSELFHGINMILCVMPDSWPALDYADYGCYCGVGGSGTPVDDLDRCCQVHDQCYTDAITCWPSGYCRVMLELFIFSFSDNNNECEMFICECDRKAAECFARSPWNPEHEHLPSDQCQ
uniref:Phospholipase A2 n=1 Tax=Oreochromis niloticus TaxID=8128 RepID=A0A669DGP0_ORENI